MGKVAIIGVGQSTFVRSYPGSIRELAFEGFKEAMQDAQIATTDVGASSSVLHPSTTNNDRRQVCSPSISVSIRNPPSMWKAYVLQAAQAFDWLIRWLIQDFMKWWRLSAFKKCQKFLHLNPRNEWVEGQTSSGKVRLEP